MAYGAFLGGMMPRLTSTTLPDEMIDNTIEDLNDDEIEVNHVKGELPEDAPVLETHRGQNEPDGGSNDDDGGEEDLDNPAIQAAVARERARLREREDAWLREQEAADNALLNSEKAKLHSQREAFKISIDAVEVRIRTAQEALKLARQDNDHNSAIDIEGQIRELESLKVQINNNMAKLPQEQQLDNAFNEHISKRRAKIKAERDGEGDDAGIKPLNSKAEKWAAANKGWFGNNADAMAALAKIDSAMATEGYDPKTDAYFTELTRRMARAVPKVGVKDLAGRGGQQQRATRPASDRAPVAGARMAQPVIGGNDPGKKIRVTLDANDRAMMKKLGLDPANEKHTARFAKERGIRLAQEAQRG